MFRKPAAWVTLAALSLASAILALRLFPSAFPIVQIDLTMDREAALAAARDLAGREGLGPPDFRQAASFASDGAAQRFVELEGGGKETFTRMLREGLYAAHTWQVRHFREGQKHETLIRFRPDGRPYGVREQLDETAPGPAIPAADARALAERKAADTWLVDFEPFALVEQSREERTSGRIDHTFTYERSGDTLNDGRYRLRLVVAGDRLTEVTHFIQIPQAFARRYEEMRSRNEAIGAAGSIAMVALYVVGGIGAGVFWLLRHRWVVARPAMLWGIGVASLQLLAGINEFPLQWMSYDTALPRASFISQQVTLLVASFAGFATLFSLSFLAAESLTRRAFGHHPQFWRVWSRDAAASTPILGRTVAGYLLVSVFFAYDVLLYLYATRWFGWWTPSDALIHPDILATYLPWLSAIANSLQAGFWEEALFRAVPIAGAALIGDRFGRRGAFIAAAFIIQTAIFGSGHATYATQPSYARPVELILPSIGFGLIYLRYGLLPGIILHYAFDVVWMAMPLFVSTSSGIWLDRTIVVVLTFVPLLVVFGARLRVGRWLALLPELRNSAWTPAPPREAAAVEPAPAVAAPTPPRFVTAWLVAGIAALVLLLAMQPPRTPVPALTVAREDAARIARATLAARGIAVDPAWRVLPIVESGRSAPHVFVWQTAGRERFEALLGRYLPTPRWRVRVATFEGDVADRAEEWAVLVDHRGEVERIGHQLPESRPGASLAESEARRLAVAAVEQTLQVPASSLKEVSAQPAKLTARTDWAFTFQDLSVPPILPESGAAGDVESSGDARIEVVVAGDEIARIRPFLRVPERWQRDQRARDTFAQIVGVLTILVAGGALVSAAVAGVVAWSRRRYFSRRTMIALFGVSIGLAIVSGLNRLPAMTATLSTAQPYELQLAMLLATGLVAAFLPATLAALAAGTFPHDMPVRRMVSTKQALVLGASAGLVLAASASVLPAGAAFWWPDTSALGGFLPLVGSAVEPLPSFLLRTITILALLTAVDDFTDGWTRRRVRFGLMLLAAGAVLGVPVGSLAASEWLPAAALAGAGLLSAYVLLLREDLSITPIATATIAILEQMRNGATADGGGTAGVVLAAALTALAAWWLFRLLRREREAAEAGV